MRLLQSFIAKQLGYLSSQEHLKNKKDDEDDKSKKDAKPNPSNDFGSNVDRKKTEKKDDKQDKNDGHKGKGKAYNKKGKQETTTLVSVYTPKKTSCSASSQIEKVFYKFTTNRVIRRKLKSE